MPPNQLPRALSLFTLLRTLQIGHCSLSISPSAITVQTLQLGAKPPSLTLLSSSPTPLDVSLRVRLNRGGRRLELAEGNDRDFQAHSAVREAARQAGTRKAGEPCKLLLKLRKQAGGTHRRRLREDSRLALRSWKHLKNVDMHLLELDCGLLQDASRSVEYIRERYGEAVEVVEQDNLLFPAGNFSWHDQWNLRRIGLPSSTAYRSAVVAVIDTGVLLNHVDLRHRLWTNAAEIPGNGVDDDGNGFVDDVHGYDFMQEDGNPNDNAGHGTHCAGIVAAVAGNAKIMALRFMDAKGGRTSDVVRALDYALAMGAQISSNSWGGTFESAALGAALRAAEQKGHLFVAAAGNEGANIDESWHSPCGYAREVGLCVAATNRSDGLAWFSNYGNSTVHVAAPGVQIASAAKDGGYAVDSGTSMACPHVAGAAALAYGATLAGKAHEAKQLILRSARRKPWLAGKVKAGLLDVAALVESARTNWLLFEGKRTSMKLRVAPFENVTVPLVMELEGADVGEYGASVLLQWESGSAEVPVSCWQQGRPMLVVDDVVDFGKVPEGRVAARDVLLRNVGNATARLRFGTLNAPFAMTTTYRELAPGALAQLSVSCAPASDGDWEATVVVESNDMMPEPPAGDELVRSHEVRLKCSGTKPPRLEVEVERFSGVSVGGKFLDGVFAAWEHELGGGSAQAALVLADAWNRQGCLPHGFCCFSRKILLVSGGGCDVQSKALQAAAAGALGLLVYGEEPSAMTPGLPVPRIPAFLINMSEGLALLQRLEASEDVEAAMHWESLMAWANHPDGADTAEVTLANPGFLAYTWSASATSGDFYDFSLRPSTFQWTAVSEDDALPFFMGERDDGATAVKLPFSFPFYGRHYEELLLSANGLLVFDSTKLPVFLPGRASKPKGFIAAFWDDLVCTKFSQLYMVANEEAVAFQFANFTLRTQEVSFEVRLFGNGTIDLHFLAYPYSESTKIGAEAPHGTQAQDFTTSLPSVAGEPFMARLSPWLIPDTETSGALAPSASGTLKFRALRGNAGWLTVAAKDASGAWAAERRVRLESKAFTARWEAGSWGECEGGERRREVACVGGDGKKHSHELCAEKKVCRDVQDWRDETYALSCEEWEQWPELVCNRYVPFEDGRSPLMACCRCGGGHDGVEKVEPPAASEVCVVHQTSSPTLRGSEATTSQVKHPLAPAAHPSQRSQPPRLTLSAQLAAWGVSGFMVPHGARVMWAALLESQVASSWAGT